jgi:hypothetical protein
MTVAVRHFFCLEDGSPGVAASRVTPFKYIIPQAHPYFLVFPCPSGSSIYRYSHVYPASEQLQDVFNRSTIRK